MADKEKKVDEKSSKPSIEVRAYLRYLRMSPTKVRAVANVIKKMPALQAVDYLKLVNKAASIPISKLLNSAIANGVHNFGFSKDNLRIKSVTVNEGPAIKRYRPRAYGRAGLIKKRSSHIEIILIEAKPTVKSGPAKASSDKDVVKKDKELEVVSTSDMKKLSAKDKKERDDMQKKGPGKKSDFVKRMFSRKTG